MELIYGNYDKFEIEKVDDIPKKTIIETYVEERAKNNKIYDMIDRWSRIWFYLKKITKVNLFCDCDNNLNFL